MTCKVLNCRYPKTDPSCRLFCFPWAGGGSNFYANWGKSLPDSLEVIGVTLAGRESRFNDPCCISLTSVIDEICPAIRDRCKNTPFAFWGHSLGALLSFEVARQMKTLYKLEPVKMFVSGVSAPHSEQRKKNKLVVSSMTDEKFKQFLRRLGGTPNEVLQNKELMDLFLPPLRADYELVGQLDYELEREKPLRCPIDVFDGKDDIEHDLKSWKDLTTGLFSINILPGGHFYLKDESNLKKIWTHLETDPFHLSGGYELEREKPLRCPIDVFDGKDDIEHDLKSKHPFFSSPGPKDQGWKDLTTGLFSINILPGGHFYLKDESNLKKIWTHLETDPFHLSGGYELEREKPLRCPIDVFDGKDDIEHDLKSWKDLTTGLFSINILPGGHFYLKDESNLKKIWTHLETDPFHLSGGYELEREKPLRCPIDVFDGKDDIEHDLKSWKDLTTGLFSINILPGGHFYLKDESNLKKIWTHLETDPFHLSGGC